MNALSWPQRRLLCAMQPGRTYTRKCDPCPTTSHTLRALRRREYVMSGMFGGEWGYVLTEAGTALRATLLRQTGRTGGAG
jgi:hypothetical protein